MYFTNMAVLHRTLLGREYRHYTLGDVTQPEDGKGNLEQLCLSELLVQLFRVRLQRRARTAGCDEASKSLSRSSARAAGMDRQTLRNSVHR
jgi:hypothetical protein